MGRRQPIVTGFVGGWLEPQFYLLCTIKGNDKKELWRSTNLRTIYKHSLASDSNTNELISFIGLYNYRTYIFYRLPQQCQKKVFYFNCILISTVCVCHEELWYELYEKTRRLLRRSLRLPKRKWAKGQAGL